MNEQELRAVLLAREDKRRDALVNDDMAGLSALLSDDLVHVHATGHVHDKSQLLNHAGAVLRFYDIERGPLQIRRLAPEVAVMTGAMTNTVGRRGEEEKIKVAAFVTQIWVERGGYWRVASFHAVRLPDDKS